MHERGKSETKSRDNSSKGTKVSKVIRKVKGNSERRERKERREHLREKESIHCRRV